MSPAISLPTLSTAPLLSGPHILFNGDFVLEILVPPPSLHATVLLRSTFLRRAGEKGRRHALCPPMHLHFEQEEGFWVVRGVLGCVEGWKGNRDGERGVGVGLGVQIHERWEPHTFFPHPDAEEDTVFYLWSTPEDVADPMDAAFFECLLRYASDVAEGKRRMNVFQIMVLQHASATAMVMFPTAWWLGPLRWWIPWKFQGAIAWVGRGMGYRPLMREYMGVREWEEYVGGKRV